MARYRYLSTFGVHTLFICLALAANSAVAVDTAPIGWATLGGGTTGGAGGPVVTVTNKADFVTYACGSTSPYIIQVVGTIHGDYSIPNVKSNKTIIGIGYDAKLIGFSTKVTDLTNVIIRNITFQGAMPQDNLILRRAQRVWIDHCTFIDAGDGQLDLTDQCDYITVSWCRFYYTSKINDHRLTVLIGSTDDNPPDVGKLNMTFHHNWWGQNCDGRMPRVRYGDVHVFNDYYGCAGNSYCIVSYWGADVLVENNYFDHVDSPMGGAGSVNTASDGTVFVSDIKASGNIFDACYGTNVTYGTAFTPAYPYTLDPAASIPSIVKAGAGTTVLVGDSSLWPTKATVPSPANGQANAPVVSTLTWGVGSTAVSHNVYLGASPTSLVSYGNRTSTSFTTPTLANDTQYYWRIDEVTSGGPVITGDLWTFKTVPVLASDLYHYWPFDVDFLDVARVFASNPNNPYGPGWLGASARLGSGCLELTDPCDALIAGWSDSGTNTVFPNAAPMTVSVWFKPTALPAAGNTACIFGNNVDTVTTAKTFRIELMPAGTCRLTIASATPAFGNSPTMNQWNHVLVTINSSGQLRAWLNASEAGSITLATSASNNYNGQYTGIGYYGYDQNNWQRGEYNGYIDDMAIWRASYDLSLAEYLYNSGSGRTAIGGLGGIVDTTPPTPNPMTFSSAPAGASPSSITMTASAASDASGVEYYFLCTTPGGHSSAWQDSRTYVDAGLAANTSYTYQVKARDKSLNQNETLPSTPAAGTTQPPIETIPPQPDPMTWAVEPHAMSYASISMTATTAADDSGVEYYFTCTAGGGHNSGWQDDPNYTDTGLAYSSTYTYTVKARDKSANHNTTAESEPASASTTEDHDAPLPNPMTWAIQPLGIDFTSIYMVAATANDASGVEYYFTCTSGGGHDSGWQISSVYLDSGLVEGQTCTYTAKARDKSVSQNTTAPSAEASGTTLNDIPRPSPMEFAIPPYATGSASIAMKSTDANDPSGVEYYFACTAGGGHDSGWQDGTSYTDTGLVNSTTYSYRVIARDKSPQLKETLWSDEASATTLRYSCQEPVAFDLDGNCQVDLVDYSMLASAWLEPLPLTDDIAVNGTFDTDIVPGWEWLELPAATGVCYPGFDGPPYGNPPGAGYVMCEMSAGDVYGHFFYQVLPVTPGQQYRFSGQWMGDLVSSYSPDPLTMSNHAELMINFESSTDPAGWGWLDPNSVMYRKSWGIDSQNTEPDGLWDWEAIAASATNGPSDGIFTATAEYMVVALSMGGLSGPSMPWVDIDNIKVEGPDCPLFDPTGDCSLDTKDLAAFAEQWLICNREPASECWW